jgi:hypothetical protein
MAFPNPEFFENSLPTGRKDWRFSRETGRFLIARENFLFYQNSEARIAESASAFGSIPQSGASPWEGDTATSQVSCIAAIGPKRALEGLARFGNSPAHSTEFRGTVLEF